MSTPLFTLYRVELQLGLQDPLVGPSTRYHNIIFICTSPSGSGRAIQVVGTIADENGMTFQEAASPAPEELDGFHKKRLIGTIRSENYDEIVELLGVIDPPPRQRIFDSKLLEWVKCKPDGSRYQEGDKGAEYWKCTEWTVLKALPALTKSRLV